MKNGYVFKHYYSNAWRTGKPTTYSNLDPNKGCGFILRQLATFGELTRKEVYTEHGGNYVNRFGKSYHSLLWTALLSDGLIEPANGGFVNTLVHCFGGKRSTVRVNSFTKDPPRYRITDKGFDILCETLRNFNRKAFKKNMENKSIV